MFAGGFNFPFISYFAMLNSTTMQWCTVLIRGESNSNVAKDATQTGQV